jgi:NADH-quinone oxidoreductase subunit J
MELLAQAAEGAGGTNLAEVALFWVFAVLAVGAAIAVITLRNIVHGALMLVLNLLAIAGLYLTLESSFLGIVQVLVYAGAIMVLFLFVIMLLGVDNDDLLKETRVATRFAAALGGALLVAALLFAFVGTYTSPASLCGPDAATLAGVGEVPCVGLAAAYGPDDGAGVAFLGLRLFTRFVWPFQLSALLLTVATIGAVILARRRDLEPEDVDLELVGPDDEPSSDAELLAADVETAATAGELGTDVPAEEPARLGASPLAGSDPTERGDRPAERGDRPAERGDRPAERDERGERPIAHDRPTDADRGEG